MKSSYALLDINISARADDWAEWFLLIRRSYFSRAGLSQVRFLVISLSNQWKITPKINGRKLDNDTSQLIPYEDPFLFHINAFYFIPTCEFSASCQIES